MKKILAMILAIIMCFCLVACSTSDEVPMVGDNSSPTVEVEITDEPLE